MGLLSKVYLLNSQSKIETFPSIFQFIQEPRQIQKHGNFQHNLTFISGNHLGNGEKD